MSRSVAGEVSRLPDAGRRLLTSIPMAERRDRREGLVSRRDEILRALVEEHIRTGEPVSSRAILEITGLTVSGATVRSELATLEREGYAVQPHTSAGRVPTAKAYRYYVDQLAAVELPPDPNARSAGSTRASSSSSASSSRRRPSSLPRSPTTRR